MTIIAKKPNKLQRHLKQNQHHYLNTITNNNVFT